MVVITRGGVYKAVSVDEIWHSKVLTGLLPKWEAEHIVTERIAKQMKGIKSCAK